MSAKGESLETGHMKRTRVLLLAAAVAAALAIAAGVGLLLVKDGREQERNTADAEPVERPSTPEEWKRAIQQALYGNRSQRALKLAREYAAIAPDRAQGAVQIARVHAYQGDADEADDVMSAAVKAAADGRAKRVAYYHWADLYVHPPNLACEPDAEGFFRVADKAVAENPKDEELVELLADRAWRLLVVVDGRLPPEDKIREVEAWLLGLASRYPKNAWLPYQLGNVCGRYLRDHAAAIQYYRRAAALEPDSPRTKWFFLRWGQTCIYNSHPKEAERVLRLAMTKPKNLGIDDASIVADIAVAQVLQLRPEDAAATCAEAQAMAKKAYGEDWNEDTATKLAEVLKFWAERKVRLRVEALKRFCEWYAPANEDQRELHSLLSRALMARSPAPK